ncbi:hypothetical protein CAAN3_03S08658 [[Candida] anglica]
MSTNTSTASGGGDTVASLVEKLSAASDSGVALSSEVQIILNELAAKCAGAEDDEEEDGGTHTRAIRGPGLDSGEFNSLVTLVLEGNLSLSQKLFIVKRIFLSEEIGRDGCPGATLQMTPTMALRVLGGVGKPMRKGTTWHKGVPITLQTVLLHWLVSSVHLIEDQSRFLGRSLSLLYGLLVYEFSRPYVVQLIFLAVRRDATRVKRWQVQLVMDLWVRFPTDVSLRGLVAMYRWIGIDTRPWREAIRGLVIGNVSAVFDYPLIADIKRLNDDKSPLAANLRLYHEFQISKAAGNKNVFRSLDGSKRRRLEISVVTEILDEESTTNQNSSHVAMGDSSLIQTISSNTAVFNPSSIFYNDSSAISTTKDKVFHLLMAGTFDNYANIDCYLRLTLLDANSSHDDLSVLVVKVADFLAHGAPLDRLPVVTDFILGKIRPDLLSLRLQLLRYLPPQSCSIESLKEYLLDPIITIIKSQSSNQSPDFSTFRQLCYELSNMFAYWYSQEHSQTDSADSAHNSNSSSIFQIIDATLPIIYSLYTSLVLRRGITSFALDMSILPILSFVQSVCPEHLNVLSPSTVALPPVMVHHMVLNNSPLVVSAVCGYVSFEKAFNFASASELEYRRLHNGYLMDILNFLWRDRCLKDQQSASSPNRAMHFPSKYVAQLQSLSVFDYSDMIQFESMGSIFNNPAWAYLTTEIVRQLEDDAEVSVRHAGPPTEHSVNSLIEDQGSSWLPEMTYLKLKVAVLRKLDDQGFKGLVDINFSSIKSLQGTRHLR